jgi:hypothetical protein
LDNKSRKSTVLAISNGNLRQYNQRWHFAPLHGPRRLKHLNTTQIVGNAEASLQPVLSFGGPDRDS